MKNQTQRSNNQFFMILFLIVFTTQSASAGPLGGIIDWFKGFGRGADNVASDVKPRGESAAPSSTGPRGGSKVVSENAEGLESFSLGQITRKVKPNSKIQGADVFSAQISRILSRRSKAAPIVVAEAGTGKSANIEYLQHLIESRSLDVKPLWGKELYFLDINKIMGGTELRGSFEKRLAQIIDELEKPENASKIMVIDELENVLNHKMGTEFLESLKSYLTSNMKVKFIFNITPGPYDNLMKDPQLVRRMIPVFKEVPSDKVVRSILLSQARSAEQIDGVRLSSEQLEKILKASKLHPSLKNPDVAITILQDAVINAVADRATGSNEIRKLKQALQATQDEILVIENMRREGVKKSFGPHFQNRIDELTKKAETFSGVIENYDVTFRQTEVLRDKLLDKIKSREDLYERQKQNIANDNLGGVNNFSAIDDLSAEIEKLSEEIKKVNPLLVSGAVTDDHILDASAVVLGLRHDFIETRAFKVRQTGEVVERVASKLNGAYKKAIEAIVKRENALRVFNEDVSDIPAFLILSKSTSDADQVVKAVVNDLTGANPFSVEGVKIADKSDMSLVKGSNQGYQGGDIEGPLYKAARLSGGNLGVLFSGIDGAVSDLLDLAQEILKSKVVLSNILQKINFSKSSLFMTSNMQLPADKLSALRKLKTETERQAFLRNFVAENFKGKTKFLESSEGAGKMDPELLKKLHIIYLDDAVQMEDQTRAILAQTLKSSVLKKALSEAREITLDFSDAALDYFNNLIKNVNASDVNQVIADEIITYLDDLFEARKIIPGDHVVIDISRNKKVVKTKEWPSGGREAAIHEMGSAREIPAEQDMRQRLQDALKLVD